MTVTQAYFYQETELTRKKVSNLYSKRNSFDPGMRDAGRREI